MDLTAALLRGTRPSVFVLTGPGGTGCRMTIERLIRVRGYRQALAPAQANVLLCCGVLDAELADRLWAQLPRPAARGQVMAVAEAAQVLDRTVAELADPVRQRAQVSAVSAPPERDMAERGPDRDGLSLDQLDVPLGPALSDWPTGLRLHLVLQGDVVQEATCAVIGSSVDPFWTVHNAPAAALDSLQRLLSVAGWSAAALRARRLRDELLEDPAVAPRQLDRWARRIRRARLLRWSTDGLGVLTEVDGTSTDATGRWLRWLDQVIGAPAPPRTEAARAHLDALAGLVVGQELAAVRLIVASLDPDIEAMISAEARRG